MKRGRPPLDAFEPLDDLLATMLCAELDRRRELPAHVRLPAALRVVRLAIMQDTERAAVRGTVTERRITRRRPAQRRPPQPVASKRSSLSAAQKAFGARPTVSAVAAAYGLDAEDLVGPSRAHNVVHVRDLAAWVLKHVVGLSYPLAGWALGGRDHSTVMAACRRVEERIGKEPGLEERLRAFGGKGDELAARAAA